MPKYDLNHGWAEFLDQRLIGFHNLPTPFLRKDGVLSRLEEFEAKKATY